MAGSQPEKPESGLARPVTQRALAALNVVKVVGPFLLAQFEKASKAFARQQARSAMIDVAKELAITDSQTLAEARIKLADQLSSQNIFERLQAEQTLEFVEEQENKLRHAVKALEYLSQKGSDGPDDTANGSNLKPAEITPHWIDKFNELAKCRNEDWRMDLLARALAAEAESPNTVSVRALWLIGTLGESTFKAFATLLDVAPTIEGRHLIPNTRRHDENFSPTHLEDEVSIAILQYLLSDVGVLAPSHVVQNVEKGDCVTASYGDHEYLIKCESRGLEITGTVLSELGAELAGFCTTQPHTFGETIFNEWITKLESKGCIVESLSDRVN